MSDEYNGIFDDLNPNDFHGVTSWPHSYDSFDEFVDFEIMSTRKAWLASDGQINPVAVLATEDRIWLYAPDDDESVQEYFDRLKGEAERVQASWLYIAKQTNVGIRSDQELGVLMDVADVEDEDLDDGVLYYAAEREKHTKIGIMRAYGNRLGEVIPGDPNQPFSMLGDILS